MYKKLQRSYLNSRFSVADGEILYEAIDQYQFMNFSSEETDSAPVTKPVHTSLEQLLASEPPPLPPRPGENEEEIYDDIDTSTPQYPAHFSNEQHLPKDPVAPALITEDEIYDDIAGAVQDYEQASTYEVPEESHQGSTKPPVPSGPRPQLEDVYEVPGEMDYEEI